MNAGEGGAYIIIYMVFPVLVTFFSLQFLEGKDVMAVAYFYFTVLFSAVSCVYDFYSRYDATISTRRNTKIFLASFPCIIVALYSIVEIVGILITHQCFGRPDFILCIYFLSVAITLWDFLLCCSHKVIFKGFVVDFTKNQEDHDTTEVGEQN